MTNGNKMKIASEYHSVFTPWVGIWWIKKVTPIEVMNFKSQTYDVCFYVASIAKPFQ